ncbi:MAG: class I SAM-dependent methyltransferase [Gloeomargaritaceae cyanobacterium C42_A2020_066]|nr:class I SAM-dependent methyltransferase [Gloeomargaritaceae cyanobacterium C42_A2020_066]
MYSEDSQDVAARFAQRPDHTGTDALVFRALEQRLRALDPRGKALDVGCGTGRSTRFLRQFGLNAVGLDVSEARLYEARRLDPDGHYQPYSRGQAFPFSSHQFQIVLATWVVLEIGSLEAMAQLLQEAARVLHPEGTLFVATNTPEFYAHRWLTSAVNFPENRPPLRSGQTVKVLLLPEQLQIEDYFWSDGDYRTVFSQVGLSIQKALYPTAPPSEPGWQDERRVAPYVIYELSKG